MPPVYDFPYQPLYCSTDTIEERMRKQAEADHINRTTDRTVDTEAVTEAFEALVMLERARSVGLA